MVQSIVPSKGGDTGSVSVTVSGAGLVSGATVKLARAGLPDIVGSSPSVAAGGSAIAATFDLTGKARGAWDVVVTNPNGVWATLAQGFTIEEGRAPQVWGDLLGRDTIRVGREQAYTILYGNRGNVDAPGAAVWISGIPKGTTLRLGPEFAPPPLPEGINVQVPWYVETEEVGIVLPLLLPTIPPGVTRAVRFSMTVPTPGAFQMQLQVLGPSPVTAPAASIASAQPTAPSASPHRGLSPHRASLLAQGSYSEDIPALTEALGIAGIRWGKDNFPVRLAAGQCCVEATNDRNAALIQQQQRPGSRLDGWWVRTIRVTSPVVPFGHDMTLLTSPDGKRDYGLDNYVLPGVIPMWRVTKPNGEDYWEIWLPPPAVPFGTIQSVVGDYSWEWVDRPMACATLGYESGKAVLGVQSRDPNDKAGSPGIAGARYISGEEPLRYTIYFENVETATAPAQEVVISDQLDKNTMDLSTLSLGLMAFGDRVVVPPPGLREFTTDVDLRPARNLIVRIQAILDANSGVLTWRFTSLDPATGRPTEDPLAGFLPPNRNPPEGDGSVLLTVMPKSGLATGTQVRNRATIVFDVNPPISTPEWLNTIDNASPSSQVLPLASSQTSASFPVYWSGADTGSGLLDYSILSSEDGGPFKVWLLNTTSTSGSFSGQPGKSYRFYSSARDNVGNVEGAPNAPDTMTTVLTPTPTPTPRPTPTPLPPSTPTPIPTIIPPAQITPVPPEEGGTSAVVQPLQETVLQLPDGTTIRVPPMALATTFQIYGRVVPSSELPVPPRGQVRKAFEIKLFDTKGVPMPPTALGSEIIIELPLTQQDLAAIGSNPNNVELLRFHGDSGVWVRLNAQVDLVERVVRGQVRQLSLFALVVPSPVAQPTATPPAVPTPTAILPAGGAPPGGLLLLLAALAGLSVLVTGLALQRGSRNHIARPG